MNGIWRFINWTLRAICIPDKHQELYYSGYKQCHGVKYKAVLTPDGLVSHLTGPYTGKESDWIAYKNSGIVTWLRELHEPQPDANQFISTEILHTVSPMEFYLLIQLFHIGL